MNWKTYKFEIITPCFCAGANQEQAEIRVPSIRGQLRWWFRALGGLKELADTPLKQQESFIFGAASGKQGKASLLRLRLTSSNLLSSQIKDAQEMNANVGTDIGYLLFPFRSNPKKNEYKGRGVFYWDNLPNFDLSVGWRKPVSEIMIKNMEALITIFGNIGFIGARGRRGFGALRLLNPPMTLKDAFCYFTRSDEITIKALGSPRSGLNSLKELARWLSGWRSHGRTCDHNRSKPHQPPHNPGFRYAKNDHDLGLARNKTGKEAYRPAIGLPIIQSYSSVQPRITVRWEESEEKGEGRFASPVVLRPHQDINNQWKSLVIFIDSHKWPKNKPVFIGRESASVSLDLYNEMKESLKDFSL